MITKNEATQAIEKFKKDHGLTPILDRYYELMELEKKDKLEDVHKTEISQIIGFLVIENSQRVHEIESSETLNIKNRKRELRRYKNFLEQIIQEDETTYELSRKLAKFTFNPGSADQIQNVLNKEKEAYERIEAALTNLK